MSFCKCPVDIRSSNAYGDEWCSICGALRFTKRPPAPPSEPQAFPGSAMFTCPHSVVIGDPIVDMNTLVQCAACARLGIRNFAGTVRWFDFPGARTIPGPPPRRVLMPHFNVTRQDTKEQIWSGEAENVGEALEKAREARPELIDVSLVGTGTETIKGSTDDAKD